MKSIGVTKPDMGVLSQDRLLLSPFGALSQAFGEELLARAQQTEGAWSYVPLELLEEGEEPMPPAPPVKPVLQVNLQLILDALRREGSHTEQQRATERIVERILQLQNRPASQQGKETGPAGTSAQPLSVTGTVHQEFHPTFIQNIRICAPSSPQLKPMGELARKAEHFSQRLQALREEGASPAQEPPLAQGKLVPLRSREGTAQTAAQAGSTLLSPLPQEALTLLEEQGSQAAQAASSAQSKELLRRADRLKTLVEDALEERAKRASGPRPSAGKNKSPDFSDQPHRTTQWGNDPENRPSTGTPDGTAPSQHSAPQGGHTRSAVNETPHTASAEAAAQMIGHGSDAPMVLGQIPGANTPAIPGQMVSSQPPVELSLRTEEERPQAGQNIPKSAPGVEGPGKEAAKQTAAPSAPIHTHSETADTQPGLSHTAARDIRMNQQAQPGGTAATEPAAQAISNGSTPMVPGQILGASTPAIPGQMLSSQPPVELSLRTEEERPQAGQNIPKSAPGVERPGKEAAKQTATPSAPVHTYGENTGTQPRPPHTAARDIRMNQQAQPGGTAATEPAAQATGNRSNAPMALGQIPGASTPAIPGQMLSSQPPVELSLRMEEENAKAGQSIPNVLPAVERTDRKAAGGQGVHGVHATHSSQTANQGSPHPWIPHTAVRDIRSRSGLGYTGPAGTGAWTVPSLPLTLNQPAQAGATPQPFSAGQTTAGAPAVGTARQGASSMTEPLSLTYGPAQSAAASPPPEPETSEPAPGEESDFVRSLPDWARRFLKQSRSASPSQPMGVARDISTLPPAQQAEEVQWTAPNYRPPQATITHREKKQEERPKAAQEVHISEAEIQRTADRVYRIIEDRIRLERRRLGL